MKIILTKKEIQECKEFGKKISEMTKSQIPNIKEVRKAINSSLPVTIHMAITGNIVIDIKEEFTIKFMSLYSKYIAMLVPNIMAIYYTLQNFCTEYYKMQEELVQKYLEK